MKKLAFLGVAAALGAAALFCGGRLGHAADHLDAPGVRMTANKMADINDVYAWTTSDGAKVNLVMTVSPADDGTHNFSPTFQYVFHVNSYPGMDNVSAFGMSPTETKVICTFASNTSVQCWVVGTDIKDYVTGDPSNTAGVTSKSGNVKVFAGRRSDPFFFNLAGFLTAQKAIETACGAGTPGTCPGALAKDAAGCPNALPNTVVATVAGYLSTTQDGVTPPSTLGPCPANQKDCFANFNVMAIVVQVDKSLLEDSANHLLGVWGSTHMAQ